MADPTPDSASLLEPCAHAVPVSIDLWNIRYHKLPSLDDIIPKPPVAAPVVVVPPAPEPVVEPAAVVQEPSSPVVAASTSAVSSSSAPAPASPAAVAVEAKPAPRFVTSLGLPRRKPCRGRLQGPAFWPAEAATFAL